MFSGRKKFKIQGKTKAHKSALMKSQMIELIRNGRIKTTPTKARALKKEFDKLVTAHKKNTVSGTKRVRSTFGENDRAIDRLAKIVTDKLSDRNSGYTRVIKTLPRKGDNAEQVYVMLVNTEFEEKKASRIKDLLDKQEQQSKGRGLRGRLGGPKSDKVNTGRDTIVKKADKRRSSK
jgi:large subunit ribosomal protein L17